MRITHITAGTAGTYCGACMRDASLARALIAHGHDVQLVPLYTPLRIDGHDPSLRRVFYGGINAYLQQRFALFRHSPAFLDRWLDHPTLLTWVSRRAVSTRPETLGAMTVSVLRGTRGRQHKELDRLLRFLQGCPRPDVIALTNTLLSGLAPALRDRLGVPVVCSLQGEEAFVDRLGQPYRDEAIEQIRQNAEAIRLFIAPSETYAHEIADWLAVPCARLEVVPPCVDLGPYTGTWPRHRRPFRVAYLSRIAPDKGLDTLVQAMGRVQRKRPGEVTLAVAGQIPGGDRPFWDDLRVRAKTDGFLDRFEYAGSPDLAGKVAFLRRASVFALPTRIAERRAIACIEAMAAGLPLVVPALGVLPELIARTGGGVLVPPDDAESLAETLIALMDDPSRADRLGAAGRAATHRHFSAEVAAHRTVQAYEKALAFRSTPP